MTPERFSRLRAALAQRQPDLTVLSENVHKPHNLAALARSCDAVGVLRIHAVAPGSRLTLHRDTAGGTGRWVAVQMHEGIEAAVSHLKNNGFQILAAHLSNSSVDYRVPDYTKPTALLLGSELFGVSTTAAALADCSILIPMRGLVASLNVSVAAALVLYEAARQREAKGMYGHCRLRPEEYAQTLFEWCHPEVAAQCRERGLPYPVLDEAGAILGHPFATEAVQDPDTAR